MEIKNKHEGEIGAYIAYENKEETGLIAYEISEPHIKILVHTEVNNNFRGKGIGEKLVMYIVEDARKNNFKIVPQCSFVAHVFKENASISDVIA